MSSREEEKQKQQQRPPSDVLVVDVPGGLFVVYEPFPIDPVAHGGWAEEARALVEAPSLVDAWAELHAQCVEFMVDMNE